MCAKYYWIRMGPRVARQGPLPFCYDFKNVYFFFVNIQGRVRNVQETEDDEEFVSYAKQTVLPFKRGAMLPVSVANEIICNRGSGVCVRVGQKTGSGKSTTKIGSRSLYKTHYLR